MPQRYGSSRCRPAQLALVAAALGLVGHSQAATPAGSDGTVFDGTVAPILARACLECHSGAEPKGGLNLSTKQSAMKGGKSGTVIEAGKPDESLLWQYLDTDEMPPKHPLPAAEKSILREWIAAGATWGSDPIDLFRVTTSKRGGYDWWSLQPLKTTALPSVHRADWAHNEIDAFVLARLEAAGLVPNPAADRRTLIRRLSFDLLGLPPDPAEIETFIADQDPEAYVKLVDRMLASPHYGERWARYWLDIAHWGESDGFEYDHLRPNAWRYRDWLVDALNADMPYDEFARLQLAGDVLHPNDPQAIVATGFLVGGAFDGLLPAGDAQRKVMRQDEVEDMTSLVGQTFLGLTIHCARCHDHKFDAIRQTDYYHLAACLGGVKRGDREIAPPDELKKLNVQLAAAQKRIGQIEAEGRRAWKAEREKQGLPAVAGAVPIASWSFEGNLNDELGGMPATAQGGASLSGGGLVLDGAGAFASTAPLTVDVRAKTLEVWLKLSRLDQGGGAAISLQTLDGGQFDAIVFGEREPRRWMAGSDGYQRTQPFAGTDETAGPNDVVHIAIVYSEDGAITAYRNGQLYGKPYKTGFQTFAAGKAQVLFGLRHSPVANGKLLAGAVLRAQLYNRALTAEEVAASADQENSFVGTGKLLASLTPELRTEYAQLTSLSDLLQKEQAGLRALKAYAATPDKPPVTHLLTRGNALQPAQEIAPGGVASVVGLDADFHLPADASDADRRTRLAAWITSDRNPLFVRAMVNRLWHYHFGEGIVPTPSDLGFSGGRPSHPELLDWLATKFQADGYSLKKMHRLIVLSATYQQSSAQNPLASAKDADNRLLWRMTPRRLDAEAIRDAMLSVAGELNTARGGPGFQDFRPFLRGSTQFYEPLDVSGPEFFRRTLYRTWARGGHSRLLDTFDCPDPSTMTPRRSSTNTPLQALSLLNNAFVFDVSARFAARLERDAGADPKQRIARAFELAYGRAPSDDEVALSTTFVERHGLNAFCRVLLNTNEFLYVR